jgi:hypothetical protein
MIPKVIATSTEMITRIPELTPEDFLGLASVEGIEEGSGISDGT